MNVDIIPRYSTDEAANQVPVLADYDAFGDRRTGGEGDVAAAAWLRDKAEATGAQARLLPARFTRLTPGRAALEGAGFAFEGLPLFDGGLTGPEGITGRLGPLGSDAPIGVAEMDPAAASLPGNAFAQARADSRHAGYTSIFLTPSL